MEVLNRQQVGCYFYCPSSAQILLNFAHLCFKLKKLYYLGNFNIVSIPSKQGEARVINKHSKINCSIFRTLTLKPNRNEAPESVMYDVIEIRLQRRVERSVGKETTLKIVQPSTQKILIFLLKSKLYDLISLKNVVE